MSTKKLYTFRRRIDWKKYFARCTRFWESECCKKWAINFVSSRDSNTISLAFCSPKSFHQVLITKLKCCTGVFNQESFFCSVAWFLDSPFIPKVTHKIDLSRPSNSNFSPTTSLISSLKVAIERSTFLKDKSLQKWFTLRLGSDFW